MEINIKKDLATSLTSLIFVVISVTGAMMLVLNSPSGESHPGGSISTELNNSIDKPFIILGNNIAIIKESKTTKKDILG